MPVKIRLQRHGKKGKPYFHIVVADARAPRDGKYIERLGFYNPNTNPATIDLDVDGAVKWLGNGAQPTDTARAILSYKGVLYKNHLLKGVKKGVLTEELAQSKFEAWLSEKEDKIQGKRDKLSSEKTQADKDRLTAEAEKNKERAAAIAAANAPEVPTEEAAAEGEEAAVVTAETAETESAATSAPQAEEGNSAESIEAAAAEETKEDSEETK